MPKFVVTGFNETLVHQTWELPVEAPSAAAARAEAYRQAAALTPDPARPLQVLERTVHTVRAVVDYGADPSKETPDG